MALKDTSKSLLRRLGLFAPARALFRRVSPTHNRERRANASFYRGLVTPGDLCFDIGANLGQTVEALTGLGARVVAVEPNPECLPVLRFQFGKNPDVEIVPKAISDSAGTATLHFSGTDSTASMREDWPFAHEHSARVEVVTLDDLIRRFGVPALLKVDVEGLELEVFRGLHHPVPVVCFEMHSEESERVAEILGLLARSGDVEGVNAVTGDNSAWLLERWVGPEAFIERMRSGAPAWANVVVRMAGRSSAGRSS